MSNPPIILASVVRMPTFLRPLLRDDADRPGQLVLDRQAAVEERDDDFLEARGERHAQEDLGRHLLALVVG